MPLVRSLLMAVVLAASFWNPEFCRAATDQPPVAVTADSEEVRQIFSADQKDRELHPGDPKFDADFVTSRDKSRQARMLEILGQGGLRTATDYLRAAYIFQHGESIDSIRVAHALSSIASYMDPSLKEARWLMAASWDRLMIRLERPQWYGTQFNRIGDTGPYAIDPIDQSTTDSDRATFFVAPLAEMRKHLDEFNSASPQPKQ
jgi:hypothetical protein